MSTRAYGGRVVRASSSSSSLNSSSPTLILPSSSPPLDHLDVIRSIEPAFEREILPLLHSPDAMWQPNDLLPDSSGSDEQFYDEVRDLRARCADLPDALLVVLIGDMITEEALPTYMAQLNTLDGIRDETGGSGSAWARWTRAWTAEENRHGDLLNKYLYMTGRVDMRAVEGTIQRLIGSGMDIKTEQHPYRCLVYTSFQERATKISHGATARLASAAGDGVLTKIAGLIAADEARHEVAYTRTMDMIFEKDPDGAVACFADMMRKQITMPAHYMDDGWVFFFDDGGGRVEGWRQQQQQVADSQTRKLANSLTRSFTLPIQ